MRSVSPRDLVVERQRSMRLAWPLRENTRTQSSMRSWVTGSGRGTTRSREAAPPEAAVAAVARQARWSAPS